MRLIGKLALGGSVASAATAGILVATGVFATSATLVVTDPAAPPAMAKLKGLRAFDSCADLLRWYVAKNVGDVGPYGWDDAVVYTYKGIAEGAGPWTGADLAARTPLAQAGTLASRTSSATGTNTQEAAVDEPDVAKTNGTLVARIVADERLVLIDVSGTEPRVTRRLHLPRNGYDNQLLLLGDHVLITQQVYGQAYGDHQADARRGPFTPYPRGSVTTRVLDVDISDPSAPKVLSTDTYTGSLLAARQYDGTVRLVTSTARPELDWVYPGNGIAPAQATRSNRALLRRTTITDWIPSVTRNGQRSPLLDCDQVLRPKVAAGGDTVAVTTFPSDDPGERTATAITAAAQVAYSSADRLYLASNEPAVQHAGARLRYVGSGQDTALYAFDVSGGTTSYVGAGTVRGSLRDRWSLDEYDGHLRVAWTTTGARGRTRNGLTVLAEKDGALVATGQVGDLGVGEDLQSVRWFDDVAVLVTFRQVDPLYTVDLGDAEHPVLMGALKIPGYSGYLHPIGDHLLLGLGMDGGGDVPQGAQAAVFDISDLRHPVRVSNVGFGGGTGLPALDDPRAFTWTPGTALTPVASWSRDTAELVALDVSPSGQITQRKLAELNHDWQARTFALRDGRVAILDSHRLRVVAG